MNVNIYNKCNNHCPYCFEESMILSNDKMNFSDFKELLEWNKEFFINGDSLKILGGEPTLNEDLVKYVEIFHKKYPSNHVVVITNLLGLSENINYLAENTFIKLLINTTCDRDKEDLFFSNLKKINDLKRVSLSITLMPNYSINLKYINRVYKIFKVYKFKSLRVGLMSPKLSQPLFDIYNYDKEIRLILEMMKDTNVQTLGFDCPINLCEISEELFENLIVNSRYNIQNLRLGGCNPICDINYDLTSNYCYCSNSKFFIKNVFEFSNSMEMYDYLSKIQAKYKIKNKKCKNCKYLNIKCFPCHSFDQALIRGEKVRKKSFI